MSINKITVVGAGTMGHGIAQVCATAGFATTLVDVEDEILQRARDGIKKSLSRLEKKEAIAAGQAKAILDKIHTTTDLAAACAQADLAIESVTENMKIKKKIFAQLDTHCPAHCLLVSNTSQLSVTAMAAVTQRPTQVAGMHWFNPPPMMKLIELVAAVTTAPETLEALRAVCKQMGKKAVVCKDSQGFISSRAFSAHLLECFRIHEEGLASKEDIDTTIKLSLGYPMGPFELADYVGLDIIYHASAGMVEAFGARFRPPQSLIKLVEAGHYGVKTGRGYYTYPREKK